MNDRWDFNLLAWNIVDAMRDDFMFSKRQATAEDWVETIEIMVVNFLAEHFPDGPGGPDPGDECPAEKSGNVIPLRLRRAA